MIDKYHGEGGTFRINKKGERELVTPPTQPHPDGDGARDKDGRSLDSAPPAATSALPEASAEPAKPQPAATDAQTEPHKKGT